MSFQYVSIVITATQLTVSLHFTGHVNHTELHITLLHNYTYCAVFIYTDTSITLKLFIQKVFIFAHVNEVR